MSQHQQGLRPAIPAGPIVTLVYRVAQNQRANLISFLKETVPFYEKPGGIRIGLYESMDEPGLLLELVAYRTASDFDQDQLRVEEDAEMKKVLDQWHEFFEGPLEVRRMTAVPLDTK